jgi:hypothetical protein
MGKKLSNTKRISIKIDEKQAVTELLWKLTLSANQALCNVEL